MGGRIFPRECRHQSSERKRGRGVTIMVLTIVCAKEKEYSRGRSSSVQSRHCSKKSSTAAAPAAGDA